MPHDLTLSVQHFLICGSSVIQTQMDEIQQRAFVGRTPRYSPFRCLCPCGDRHRKGGREKDTERERRWGGVNKNRATILAWESLPGPECFSFTSDKVNTEPATFVCLFRETGFWCHSTKWDGANRNVMIKNQGCFRCFFFFFFFDWMICHMLHNFLMRAARRSNPLQSKSNVKGNKRATGEYLAESWQKRVQGSLSRGIGNVK